MKNINWASPLVTVIQENTIITSSYHQYPQKKSILKPPRTEPFPFVEEIIEPSSENKKSSTSPPSLHLKHKPNKAWIIILDLLKFLFANKVATYITNLIVTFIGLIAIGMLRLIVNSGKVLLEINYSLIIEFFLLLNPTCDHSAITTGVTNSFSKRRRLTD